MHWIISLHGVGHGKGASPAMCEVVSMPILLLLRKKNVGGLLIVPISSLKNTALWYIHSSRKMLTRHIINNTQETLGVHLAL
jgi:hypothetical protein